MKSLIATAVIAASLAGCASAPPDIQQPFDAVYSRFEYVSDMEQYGVNEYRVGQGYFVTNTDLPVRGDCEDFAMTFCQVYKAGGGQSECIIKSVLANGGSHAVAVVNGWVADNMHPYPYKWEDMLHVDKHKVKEVY